MELKKHEKWKKHLPALGCVLILTLLFLLLLWRVPFGYDWTDEGYYSVVAYRFLLGDRPLLDTWEVHQFSGLLALPFLRAYLLFHPSGTDGVLLYFRYVYVSIQYLIGLYAFHVLKKRSGAVPACIAAAMLLCFTHFAINGYYYDTMALLFCVLSALLVFDFLEGGRTAWPKALLAGAAYAFAVQAYPYFILSLPVYVVFWLVLVKRRGKDARIKRGAVCFAGGVLLVAAALATVLLTRLSPREVLHGVSNLFSDPDHQAVNPLRLMGSYLNAIRVLYGPVSYGAAALCLLGGAYLLIRRETARRMLRTIGAALALLLLAGAVLRAVTYDWDGIYRINLLAMGFALTAPGLFLFAGRKADRNLLLYFLGCALSVCVQIGSNTRIRASSGMLLPASVATVLYLFDHRDELFRFGLKADGTQGRARAGRIRRAAVVCAAVVCAAGAASLLLLRMTAMYRDEPISELNAVVETGPAQGIRTTAESADRYGELVTEIRENAPQQGTILITSLFPDGYLVTGLKPATPSAFFMTMDSQWLSSYYAEHPERIPTYVFALYSTESYNAAAEQGASIYADDPAYETLELTWGTAYIRISD